MAEYIDKDELLNAIECIDISDCTDIDDIFIEVERTIDERPAADVVEVKHGKWIRPNVPNTRSYKWQCSECGQIAYWLHYGNRGNKNIICKFGYCPHCGARMDGDTK